MRFKIVINKLGLWILNFPRNCLKFMILFYKLAISPLIVNRCRFYPSCSMYALDALNHFGFVKGLWLMMKRLFKCHPWHEGGYDPLYIVSNRDSAFIVLYFLIIKEKEKEKAECNISVINYLIFLLKDE